MLHLEMVYVEFFNSFVLYLEMHHAKTFSSFMLHLEVVYVETFSSFMLHLKMAISVEQVQSNFILLYIFKDFKNSIINKFMLINPKNS